MGILGDFAKAVGLSSDGDANSDSGAKTNASSWSDIFNTPPTVIKANGGPVGPICDKTCAITDAAQCVPCLERQAATMSGVNEIRTLERVLKIHENKPAVFVPRRMKYCAVCSAPFESGKSACEYCGTHYPDDWIGGDIPDDMAARGDFFATKSEEAYKRFTDWEKYRQKLEEVNTVGKIVGMLSKGKLESRNMTADEIKEGAASKNLSCSDYIGGIIRGEMKPVTQEKREKTMLAVAGTAAVALIASAALSDSAPSGSSYYPAQSTGNASNPYAQRSAEIEAERQRKLEEIKKDRTMIQKNAERIRLGPAACCGNCRHYMAADNDCALSQFKRPSGASDYCRDYWKK